jgi:hypothetical protein
MCSRLAFALLFSVVLSAASPAQQITGDVMVQGASLNDGYMGFTTCGADGQVYRRPGSGAASSVMRISPDGSSLVFTLPEHTYPGVIAPVGTGVNILSAVYATRERRVHFQMYHFDGQASLLEQDQGTLLLYPHAMAMLPSGRTIMTGDHLDDPDDPEDRKYGFAILDENDKLVKSVYLPLPPGGGGWTFASGEHMAVGDGVAYVMLHSNEPPQTAVAMLSEEGHIDITEVAVPPDSDAHITMSGFSAPVSLWRHITTLSGLVRGNAPLMVSTSMTSRPAKRSLPKVHFPKGLRSDAIRGTKSVF